MSKLDSVTIEVTDGIKQGDYAPNKAYKLIGILVNADEAAITAGVDMLRRAGEHYLRPGSNDDAVREAIQEKRTRTPKNAAPKEETPAPAPAPLPTDPAPPVSEPTTATEAGSPSTSEPTSDVADILGGAATEPVKEITNDEIVHAGMQANERLKGDTKKIRDLIETYNPAPGLRVFKATEIEQKDRAAFLAKLKELV